MGLSDLTVRDWMVIIGVLLILAVLLDAWRRVRSDKQSRVKMKLVDPEQIPPEPEDDFAHLRELPNGGARVVDRSDLVPSAGRRRDPDDPTPDFLEGLTASGPEGEDKLGWLEDDAPPQEEKPAAGKLPREAETEVFMLNVVARSERGFNGEDIMQILLACDLRFGDMNFFHRHEYEAGRGAIQFSVANMMQPGVFDIDNMADMKTPGLVFFLTLPGPDDMMKAFDYMLETAQAVARNLGGDVLDESRSVLTRQTLDHSRQQIRDLERRMLARAPGA